MSVNAVSPLLTNRSSKESSENVPVVIVASADTVPVTPTSPSGDQVDKVQKQLLPIIRCAPFKFGRFTRPIYVVIAAFIMMMNIVMCAVSLVKCYNTPSDQRTFCPLIGWLTTWFQIESLILYIFAYRNINCEFVNDIAKMLVVVDDPNPSRTLHRHLLGPSLIMLCSYLSGYLVFLEPEIQFKPFMILEELSYIFDILRYIPQIFHIALVTLFYSTFHSQISTLREKWNIPDSKTKVQWDQLLNHEKLSISHHAFKSEFERVVRPYYLMTRNTRTIAWIMSYLVLNLITLAFWWLAVLSPQCQKHDKVLIYDIHYAFEFLSFFAGWIYVMIPFYWNQQLLSRFAEDVRKLSHEQPSEYTAIMVYLDGLVRQSPVTIRGYDVTLYGLTKMLLLALGSVLYDFISDSSGVNLSMRAT